MLPITFGTTNNMLFSFKEELRYTRIEPRTKYPNTLGGVLGQVVHLEETIKLQEEIWGLTALTYSIYLLFAAASSGASQPLHLRSISLYLSGLLFWELLGRVPSLPLEYWPCLRRRRKNGKHPVVGSGSGGRSVRRSWLRVKPGPNKLSSLNTSVSMISSCHETDTAPLLNFW